MGARAQTPSAPMVPQNPRAVLLASGGMDSTVLAHWMADKGLSTCVVFFDYGQHCVDTEFRTLLEVLPPGWAERVHRIRLGDLFANSRSRLIREPDLWNESVVAADLILPYRNLLFLGAGAAFCASIGASLLFSAFINSNHAREIDATRVFLDSIGDLITETGNVQIKMPFREMSKADVARLGSEMGVPIAMTYSCQANANIHCGACPNCVDRIEALRQVDEAAAK